MTYKRDNNDPDRTKTVLGPAEVRRMMGGDPAAETPSGVELESDHRIKAIFASPGVLHALTSAEYKRARAQSAGRCPTCGRAFDCACGDDCTHCVDGVPVLSDEELYAPASR
jgi:hypothetical protein